MRPWVQTPGKKTIFHAPFVQHMKEKKCWNVPNHLAFCMSCNPVNGRADFEDNWLIKSSFINKDSEGLRADQDRSLTKISLPSHF
jgi:hypothetical protein